MFSNKAKHCLSSQFSNSMSVYITTKHTLIRRPTLFKTILFIFNFFIKTKDYPSSKVIELKIPGKIKAGTKTRDKSKPATITRDKNPRRLDYSWPVDWSAIEGITSWFTHRQKAVFSGYFSVSKDSFFSVWKPQGMGNFAVSKLQWFDACKSGERS